MNTNIILNTDSYKASHFLQYPQGTEYVSSYIESRGGRYKNTLFFGIQGFIKSYLIRSITQEDIDKADKILTAHGLPFNRQGWEYILKKHHGKLPLKIDAVAEGSIIPTNNVLVQVQNTDANCFWLTSYIETALLRAIWYPTTVATQSYYVKQIIADALLKTTGSTKGIEFKLHDFGARGTSSEESAAIGGAAHLVNFAGTDTLSGILYAKQFYQEDMAGFSIPAAEHSTMTAWGKDKEAEAYANILRQFSGKDKLVAVVSDSYDLFNALNHIWGESLKDKVINNGGTIIIRPDSGNPVDIVCKTITILMQHFGFKTNQLGYKVLPNYLRVIQGDGVNPDSIKEILNAMIEKKLSIENIAFGMGGRLLQAIDRDTQKFAMKASAVKINHKWQEIYKQPSTDITKSSKRGILALIYHDHQFQTIKQDSLGKHENLLKPVFVAGELINAVSFNEIRERANNHST